MHNSPRARAPMWVRSLPARWTRATLLGWALGIVLLLVCVLAGEAVGLGDKQFPVGLGMGLGVGLVQRRVIRERFGAAAGSAWWWLTTLGVTLPFIVRDVAAVLDRAPPYHIAGSVVLGGVIVGLLQWRVLRERARAWQWVPASVAGWALAGSTAVLNDRFLPKIPGIVGALLYLGVIMLGGVLLGAVQGAALSRIEGSATTGG